MKQQDLARLVHERMGHISLPRLADALKQGMKTGTGLTLAAVKSAMKSGFHCAQCDLAKITRAPEPSASNHVKTERLLGVLHGDLMVRPEDMVSKRDELRD